MIPDQNVSWESRPDSRDATTPFKLFRVPAKGIWTFYILSKEVIGVRVHFFKGRTTPHGTPVCDACEAGIEARWRGYIAAANKHDYHRGMIELTAGPAQQLIERLDRQEIIRGLVIQLSRPGGRPNSRIQIDIRPADIDPSKLPPAFDVQATLMKIWNRQPHMQVPQVSEFRRNGHKASNAGATNNDHQQG